MASPFASSVTLEDLAALNDEIVALTRAGVPLEAGLRTVAGDLPRSAGELGRAMADDLASGRPLDQVVAEPGRFPPLYAALVTIGLRTGRLPAALEAFSTVARRRVDIDRTVRLSLIYPLMLVLIGYVLFLVAVLPGLREIAYLCESWNPAAAQGITNAIESAQRTMSYWAPWPALFLVLLLGIIVYGGLRRRGPAGGWRNAGGRLFPWYRRAIHYSQLAVFTDLLALLVRAGTPLADAVRLAGEATGAPKLRNAAVSLSERIMAGGLESRTIEPSALPSRLSWLIAAGGTMSGLDLALQRASSEYRFEANMLHSRIIATAPLVLSAGLGGGLTLVYLLALYLPMIEMLKRIALPIGTP